MKRELALLLLALPAVLFLSSCGTGVEEPKPAPGPVSETSKIPWNSPLPGQGQGQFGMMPQNQYRR